MATTAPGVEPPAYFRELARQMQSEFARAVAALEKQVATLSQHNELLQRSQRQLQVDKETIEADLYAEQQRHQATQEAATSVAHERDALKLLLSQESEFAARAAAEKQHEVERLTQQLVVAAADAKAQRDTNRSLRRELRTLQSRVDAAVHTSQAFDERLRAVADDKRTAVATLEAQASALHRKLDAKREQVALLSDRLGRRRHAFVDRDVNMEVVKEVNDENRPPPSHHEQVTSRRVRKRELTMPELVGEPSARFFKSKRLGEYQSSPSSGSSSPEDAVLRTRTTTRSPLFKRAPSIATTSPTTTSSHSSSVHSLHERRRLPSTRTTAVPTTTSSHNSSFHDLHERRRLPTTRTTAMPTTTSTSSRLERELSGLRRKLDACIQRP